MGGKSRSTWGAGSVCLLAASIVLVGCGSRRVGGSDDFGGTWRDGNGPERDQRIDDPRDAGPGRDKRPGDLPRDKKKPLDRQPSPDVSLQICKQARTLKLKNEQATLNSSIGPRDSVSLVTYFPNGCTGQPTPGAERFYRFEARYNYLYAISLAPGPTFNPALYVLSSCTEPKNACLIGRDSFFIGRTESLTFLPPRNGTYYIGVDSRYPPTKNLSFGPFKLDVVGTLWAYFDACARALPVKLTNNKASIYGDTAGGKNEFGGGIRCGLSTKLVGPQRYYRLALTRGKTYKLTFTPRFSAVLYIFPRSACGSASRINAACASSGKTGAVLGPVSSGVTRKLTFKPPSTTEYLLTVDSTSASQKGDYTLEVN